MSMTLKNVRCFGSPAEELSLASPSNPKRPARWTVILGANGVGKTTVLRALAMLRSVSDLPRRDLLLPTEHFFIRSSHEEGHFSVQKSNGSETQWRVSAWGERPVMKRDYFDFETVRIAGYGAGRAWRGTRDDENGAVATLFDRDAQVRDPNETLFRFDYREKSETSGRLSRFQAFKSALTSGILPDVTDLEMGFAENDRPVIRFKTQDGWIALDDMSWGYQVFAAFAADYASRLIEWYPDSKTPLHEPGICLVDELDLHMHPKWQREVIEHLSRVFPATQFVVTVHSPLVVQAAEDANLVVLKRYPEDRSRVQIDNDVEAIKGWRIDQVLTSDLFGLDSVRTKTASSDLEELQDLKLKVNPSRKDKARVIELEEKVRSLPSGETAWDMELRQAIREAAKALKA